MVNKSSIMLSVLTCSSVAIFFSLKKAFAVIFLWRRLSIILNAHVYFERVDNYIKDTHEDCYGCKKFYCEHIVFYIWDFAWRCVHVFSRTYVASMLSFVRKYNFIFVCIHLLLRVTVTLHYKEPSNWENGS